LIFSRRVRPRRRLRDPDATPGDKIRIGQGVRGRRLWTGSTAMGYGSGARARGEKMKIMRRRQVNNTIVKSCAALLLLGLGIHAAVPAAAQSNAESPAAEIALYQGEDRLVYGHVPCAARRWVN